MTRRCVPIWSRWMLAVLLCATYACSIGHMAVAAGSQNVVIIGGSALSNNGYDYYAANVMGCTGGGFLPVTGPAGELGDIAFTPMMPADVSAASLAGFDTAVLNVASVAMCCNNDILTAQQKADLIAFVGSGKKLIIYDSECYPGPVDYSWLPYPFSTSNPGALGQQGSLTITENSTLGSNDPLSPYFIDSAWLGSNTDAVGDMNVMVTFDSHWCEAVAGTNALGVWGSVHTYATYPAGTDKGLIIYNGLDQDYQWNDDPWLRKMWVLELQQPWNPSRLPCIKTLVGITLTPASASNPTGTSHTVTATIADQANIPQPGVQITFLGVVSGPNAGTTSTTAGTTLVPADGITDANGQVTFTYTSNSQPGTDEIKGCFVDDGGSERCHSVFKEWVRPPNTPPDCSMARPSAAVIWPPNHKMVAVNVLGVTDLDGDAITIVINSISQDEPTNGLGDGDTAVDGGGIGTDTAQVRAERSGTGNGRVYVISFTASDGKGGTCSGSIRVCVPHDLTSGQTCIDDGQNYDSTK